MSRHPTWTPTGNIGDTPRSRHYFAAVTFDNTEALDHHCVPPINPAIGTSTTFSLQSVVAVTLTSVPLVASILPPTGHGELLGFHALTSELLEVGTNTLEAEDNLLMSPDSNIIH
ncbi:UNVERIFIED_CONTAM: hypothetical protein K2H54_049012 [Gekko kuhli]